MPKEKNAINPAAAALKAQKKSALKKSKAAVATQRTERLSKRNPDRLQRQIDDLKASEAAQGGQLRPRDKQQLEQLERDVKAIRKARESAPGGWERDADSRARARDGGSKGGRGGGERGRGRGGREGRGGHSTLGKRRRSPSRTPSPPTDEDVRRILMPLDSPPPIPQRPRRQHQRRGNPNDTPLGPNARPGYPQPDLPPKPVSVAQTTYSSAPVIRNLQKESTGRFVPAAVAARLKERDAFRGGGAEGADKGKLLEPEEVDRLEKEGYLAARGAADEAAKEEAFETVAEGTGADWTTTNLEEEEAAFERELRDAEVEVNGDGQEDTSAETVDSKTKAEDAVEPQRPQKPRFALVEDVDDDTW